MVLVVWVGEADQALRKEDLSKQVLSSDWSIADHWRAAEAKGLNEIPKGLENK
ncbi:hypothetical protein DPMN_071974 [Dreissena polymorpha]|uniref:Uncharacterized protein n=1 Tax=Dreissena polymorpha TaxID=45954 RepID=A0A9D3Z7J4_DREPO|nr:hypothetical protein DPMN_071974 [Dreissena polymorpha]